MDLLMMPDRISGSSNTHSTDLKRRIGTFIRGREQGKLYLTLLDINTIGRLYTTKSEIKGLTEDHPMVFFVLSPDRFTLTRWVVLAVEELFLKSKKDKLPIDYVHDHLRGYFKTKVFSLGRLKRLFQGGSEISRTQIDNIKTAVEGEYRSAMDTPHTGKDRDVFLDLVGLENQEMGLESSHTYGLPSVLDKVMKDERTKSILISRSEGNTLEEVSSRHGITRERVRQIEKKAVTALGGIIGSELSAWLNENGFVENQCLNVERITETLGEDGWNILEYVLRLTKPQGYYALKKSNVYLYGISKKATDTLKALEDKVLLGISKEDISELVLKLREEDLFCLTEEALIKHIESLGYRSHGDVWSVSNVTIRKAASLVMADLRDDTFKISDPEDTRKMRMLIMQKGALPSAGDRAFWTAVTEAMVLCDKGTYCSPNRIKIPQKLLDDIVSYVERNLGSGMFYKSVFSAFSNELSEESNIDNQHFLHGVLAYYFPDKFGYAKDHIYPIREDAGKISPTTIINDYLKERHAVVSKGELAENIIGLTDIQIYNAQKANQEILHWEENSYLHASALQLESGDKSIIGGILQREFKSNSGYSSAYRLHSRLIREHEDFIQRCSISNEENSFSIAEFLLNNMYSFSFPHIVKDWPKGRRFTTLDLIKGIVGVNKAVRIGDLTVVAARKVGKTTPSIGYAVRDYCLSLIRLDEDRYVKPESIANIDKAASALDKNLDELLKHEEAVILESNEKWRSGLPHMDYEWTPFIAGSIVNLHLPKYRVIGLSVSGAASYSIVKANSTYKNKDDILLSLIKTRFNSASPEESVRDFVQSTRLFKAKQPQVVWKNGSPVIISNGEEFE